MFEIRKLTSKYLRGKREMSIFNIMRYAIISPDINIRDIKFKILSMANNDKYMKLQEPLMDYLFNTFNLYDYGTEYKVAICYISGDSDWTTPYPLVKEYYNSVQAPKKDMILIKDVGHNTFGDDSEEFTKIVRGFLDK